MIKVNKSFRIAESEIAGIETQPNGRYTVHAKDGDLYHVDNDCESGVLGYMFNHPIGYIVEIHAKSNDEEVISETVFIEPTHELRHNHVEAVSDSTGIFVKTLDEAKKIAKLTGYKTILYLRSKEYTMWEAT